MYTNDTKQKSLVQAYDKQVMENKAELYSVESKIRGCCGTGICSCFYNPKNTITFYDKHIVVNFQRFALKSYMVVLWVVLLLVSIRSLAIPNGSECGDEDNEGGYGDEYESSSCDDGGMQWTGTVGIVMVVIGAIVMASLGHAIETMVIPRSLITNLQYLQRSTFRCTPVTSSLQIGTLDKWNGWVNVPCCFPYCRFGLETRGVEVFLGDVRVDTQFLVEYLDQDQPIEELKTALLGSPSERDPQHMSPFAHFAPGPDAPIPLSVMS